MYLLDTNIVSADAHAKRVVAPGKLAERLHNHSDHLFMSSVTVAEIEAGIVRAARIGAATKAERLRR